LSAPLAVAGLLLLAAQAERPPTFAVTVEAVNVDVLVTRGGRVVEGLRGSDFLVTDRGVRQQVEVVESSGTHVDAVLVLDASSSVGGAKLAALKEAAHRFVDALWPTDSVAVLAFSTDLRLVAPTGPPGPGVHAAIERLEGAGATTLVDAAFAALLLTSPQRGRPLVVVFSDGVDHGSWLAPDAVIEAATACDVVVHYVEVEGALSFLSRLADATGGQGWSARRWGALPAAFVEALDEFRSRYRLRYEPSGVARAGFHRLQVRLRSAKGRVRARPGYWVPGERDGR
jgi:VWFA-related protein